MPAGPARRGRRTAANSPAGEAERLWYALRRAYGAIYLTIQQQAALLAYVRIIEILAVITAIFVPLILLFLKKNQPGGAPAGAH